MEEAWELAALAMAELTPKFESLLAEIRKASEETIGSIGKRFDFSVASVGLLDSLVDGLNFEDDEEKLIDFGGCLGAYIGEVVRRNGLGDWISSSTEPEFPTENPMLIRTPRSIFDPIHWAMKRILNGPEDNLQFKFDFMVLNKGELGRSRPKKEKGILRRFIAWSEGTL